MDGMAEVTNHIIDKLLWIHVVTNRWVATLSLVAMIIKGKPQSRMGRTPHEVAYGCKLRMPMDVITTTMTVPTTKEYIPECNASGRVYSKG